ncbi:hypothetical protein HZB93_04850 [Candidatus Falkowbacteria bacterium]|nr:hypothetical protein [Candidatus Falkowbacteria bacterium]
MIYFKKILLIIFFVAFLLPQTASAASNPVELYFFEGQGCPHCARMASYLEGLKVDYPNLTVHDFEVYFNKENQELFQRMAAAYGSDSNGVPMIFIGDDVVVGENYEKLKSAVEKCSTEICVSPLYKLETSDANNNSNQPAVPGTNQNEMVGWIVIGIIILGGVGLIIFYLRR